MSELTMDPRLRSVAEANAEAVVIVCARDVAKVNALAGSKKRLRDALRHLDNIKERQDAPAD